MDGKEFVYLNTSHVTVNPTNYQVQAKVKANLNTSHVTVNPAFISFISMY